MAEITVGEKTEIGAFPGGTAEVLSHRVWGTEANSLVIRFDELHSSLSGKKGFSRVRLVCNSYMPKDLCDYLHHHDLSYDRYLGDLVKGIADYYGISPRNTTAVATGVEMHDLSQAFESHENLWTKVWITAGFKHNAMRAGADSASGTEVNGKYMPCGTINIIATTNARLSLATMASSFITITEAKGATLQDLAIHSSLSPGLQATGTGTDQIVVISGDDFTCRYIGGHTKLGELLSKAVVKACKGACERQLVKDPNYYRVDSSRQVLDDAG